MKTIEKLENRVTKMVDTLKDLQHENSQRKQEVSFLKTQVDSITHRLTERAETLSMKVIEIDNLTRLLNDMESSVERVTKTIDAALDLDPDNEIPKAFSDDIVVLDEDESDNSGSKDTAVAADY